MSLNKSNINEYICIYIYFKTFSERRRASKSTVSWLLHYKLDALSQTQFGPTLRLKLKSDKCQITVSKIRVLLNWQCKTKVCEYITAWKMFQVSVSLIYLSAAEGTQLLVSLRTAFPEEYRSATEKLSPETLQELENQSNVWRGCRPHLLLFFYFRVLALF